MKKNGLLLILSTLTLFSCSEKTVDLSPVDILTGGRVKVWKFAEWHISGEDVIKTMPCYSDDTATFSKGDPLDSLNKSSFYKYKVNDLKCGLTDVDEYYPFHVSSDRKSIIFGENDEYQILELDAKVFVMQKPDGSRRMRLIPKDSTSTAPAGV